MQVGWFSVLSFASSERYLRVDAVSSDTLVKEDFILWVQHEARCHNHVNDDSRSFKVLLLRRLLNYLKSLLHLGRWKWRELKGR